MKHSAKDATVVLERRFRDTFTVIVLLAERSMKFGSEITGAQGVAVDEGTLQRSYLREPGDAQAIHVLISSNLPYAKAIEDGVGPHGPLTLRAETGGFHSNAITFANMDRIIAAAMRAVENSNG